IRFLVDCFNIPSMLDEFEDLGRWLAEIRANVVTGLVIRLARYQLHSAKSLNFNDLTSYIVGFLASTHGVLDLIKLHRRFDSIDSLAPDGIYWRDVVARFVAVDDITPLIYDFIDLITGVVRGIEYDGESRSGRQPERRDDLFDGNLGFLLERLLEIWREFFFDV